MLAGCLTETQRISDARNKAVERNLNRRWCGETMSIENRTEFSRRLWGGYGHILRILWWLRWPVLGLVAVIAAIKIIQH
jgi:hypothetical protein